MMGAFAPLGQLRGSSSSANQAKRQENAALAVLAKIGCAMKFGLVLGVCTCVVVANLDASGKIYNELFSLCRC